MKTVERLERGERTVLATLVVLGAITGGWWALALWPVPGETPYWLARTRAVCFGTTESGLPDASGWLLLIGQPLGMLGLLMVGWGRTVRSAVAHLTSGAGGRAAAGLAVAVLQVGLGAAGVRVARASEGRPDVSALAGAMPTADYPRLDRTPPSRALVDQHGERFSPGSLRGRTSLVTFAFGHCETLCPVVVGEVLAARDLLEESGREAPAVSVLTLDPWRDTPDRLAYLAGQWDLPEDARVLSGEVAEVNEVLDEWGITRARDPLTGDITHPPLVFVLDRDGVVAYASTGGAEGLAELVRRAEAGPPQR